MYYLQKHQNSRTNSDLMGEKTNSTFSKNVKINPLVYVWKSIHHVRMIKIDVKPSTIIVDFMLGPHPPFHTFFG